jgi:hypothetical protein
MQLVHKLVDELRVEGATSSMMHAPVGQPLMSLAFVRLDA